ncbi:MAG: hypothetical protein ACTS42_00575 [Candidatus Hodgkinia cicadicola]
MASVVPRLMRNIFIRCRGSAMSFTLPQRGCQPVSIGLRSNCVFKINQLTNNFLRRLRRVALTRNYRWL